MVKNKNKNSLFYSYSYKNKLSLLYFCKNWKFKTNGKVNTQNKHQIDLSMDNLVSINASFLLILEVSTLGLTMHTCIQLWQQQLKLKGCMLNNLEQEKAIFKALH